MAKYEIEITDLDLGEISIYDPKSYPDVGYFKVNKDTVVFNDGTFVYLLHSLQLLKKVETFGDKPVKSKKTKCSNNKHTVTFTEKGILKLATILHNKPK